MPLRSYSALALVTGLVACVEPEAEQVWEGEYVTLRSSTGVRPCGGTLAFYDRYVAHTHQIWSQAPVPAEFAMTLELRRGKADLLGRAYIPSRYAWSRAQASALHELGHLVTGWHKRAESPFFSEGAAEAFGAIYPLLQWRPVPNEPDRFIFDSQREFENGDYEPAANFVTFLIRRYGLGPVRTAFEVTRYGPDREANKQTLERVFRDVFDEELADVLAEFRRAPACPLQAWECGGEVVPVKTLPVHVGPELDCDHPQTLGAVPEGAETADDWYPMHMFTLDLGPEAMSLEVEVDPNTAVYLEECIASCAEASFSPYHGLGDDGRGETRMLPSMKGRHVVRVQAWNDPSLPFGAHFRAGET